MQSDPFNYLWNGVISIGALIMSMYIKSNADAVKEHRDLIAKTREEMREKYVHKLDMQRITESLTSRLDRIEEKIDKLNASN